MFTTMAHPSVCNWHCEWIDVSVPVKERDGKMGVCQEDGGLSHYSAKGEGKKTLAGHEAVIL